MVCSQAFFRAIFYKQKYLELKSLKRQRESDYCDYDNDSKKLRMINQDPMEILPEKCKLEILKFFKGKELLRLIEISTLWKKEIALMPQLMTQAMDNVKLRIKDEFMKDDWKILLKNKRQYKHLELIDCFEEEGGILNKYSRSLLSLSITDTANFHRRNTTGCAFHKLRKLCIDHYDNSWFNWLLTSSFPNLKELRYKNQLNSRFLPHYPIYINSFSEFLMGVDNVEHLYMRVRDDVLQNIIDIEIEDQLELKSADFGHQFPKQFLLNHSHSLTILRAGCTMRNVSIILENFKMLKTLAVNIVPDYEEIYSEEEEDEDEDCIIIKDDRSIDDINIPRHDKISMLFIQTETPKMMYKVLKALPRLETLVNYNFISKRDLQFISK